MRAVVFAVVGIGAISVALLAWLPGFAGTHDYLLDPAPVWVLALFVMLAAVSDVIYVPVRHADAWEELTFVEVVIVWGVLLLAPLPAMLAALAGFAITAVILRRPFMKSVFNLGMYAVSGAGLFITYYLIVGDADRFSFRSVLALLVGALVFTVLNLLALSMILLAAEEVPPREFIAEQWWLSVGMAVGSVGVAVVSLSLASTNPVLTPFAALPAVAMWYAYRTSSSHAEARERSRWLVQLGQAVATPGAAEDVVPRAADALRRVYGADDYLVVLRSGERFGAAAPDWSVPHLMPREARYLEESELPVGWSTGVAVRLDDQSGPGVLALGSGQARSWADRNLPWARSWSVPDTDMPALVALTSAVGSSLRAGQTLSALTSETAKLQAVVDHATDGIAVVDPAGQIVLWSPAAERITGVSRPTGELPEIVRQIISVGAGEQGHELEFERADGQVVSLQITRVDVWAGMASSVLTIRDMTRERRAERLKSDFIATISHELRTPITPIKGYADLLKRRWDRMSEEKRMSVLDTIEERANHLTRLVDDLLIAARADTETSLRVDCARMDVVEVVNGAATAFPEADGRLHIQSSPPIWVHADRTRVAQIIGNLVGNALKYTPEGTDIDITFSGVDPVEVAVTDHGPGIAADEQEKVFERFYRIEDPLTMRTGGSGLGLHISQQLARAMGGDVRLQSSPGQGSTFTVLLAAEGE